MQGERELVVADAPEVALDAVGEPDAGLGRAVGEDLGDVGQLDESVEDRARVVRAEEDVEVADRLGPPAEAPANLGPDHAGVRGHLAEDRGDQSPGRALQDPVADRFEELDPFEDLGLGLRPESLQGGDLARLAGRPEVGQALDLELVMEES